MGLSAAIIIANHFQIIYAKVGISGTAEVDPA